MLWNHTLRASRYQLRLFKKTSNQRNTRFRRISFIVSQDTSRGSLLATNPAVLILLTARVFIKDVLFRDLAAVGVTCPVVTFKLSVTSVVKFDSCPVRGPNSVRNSWHSYLSFVFFNLLSMISTDCMESICPLRPFRTRSDTPRSTSLESYP